MTTQVENELQDACSIRQGRMPRQDYLHKLVEKAGNLSNDAWDDLSEPAQAWVNAGIRVYNKDTEADIPEFADGDNAAEDPATEETVTMAKTASAKKKVVEAEAEAPAPAPARSKKVKETAAAAPAPKTKAKARGNG